MEERIVLGSRLNGQWLSILFRGDTVPTFVGNIAGRDVPKCGDKVTAIKEHSKTSDKEYTNYYW
jgi:hypothetical protein